MRLVGLSVPKLTISVKSAGRNSHLINTSIHKWISVTYNLATVSDASNIRCDVTDKSTVSS